MFKKLVIIIGIAFLSLNSIFANYTISKSDYQKIEKINHKLENIINKKYSDRKNYAYKVIVDTIDGYLALHKISDRKKVMLLCIKTYFIKKGGFKIGNPIQVDIIE